MSASAVSLHAHGMHCHGCEHIIEMSVGKIPGVQAVKADYPTEMVRVTFDPAATKLEQIRATIESAGYRTYLHGDPHRRRKALWKLAALIGGVAGILFIIFFDTEWISQGGEPDISQHMSLGLLFLLGLLTGFHCVGMCGGFVLSYTADDASEDRTFYLSHLLYGAGKTFSYTVIGATFGLLGAFVTFTPLLRGVAGVLAGVFLIVFGLSMLGLFAPLRRFRLGLPPTLQTFLDKQTRTRHQPFVIGLLNGLMIACGPLQAMYVMAGGTGSAVEGAKMLFAFGVGTLPVLLSFGMLTTLLSASLTHRLLKASGVIVVVLGAVMINRGLILTGSGYDLNSMLTSMKGITAFRAANKPPVAPLQTESSDRIAGLEAQTMPPSAVHAASRPRPAFQTIEMDVTERGYPPNHFVLVRGVPVRWVINGKQVTTCNHRIVVPSLKLEFDVKQGRQTIEFTPAKVGVVPWSCWMGMLHGDFEVVEAPPRGTDSPGTSVEAPKQSIVAAGLPNAVASSTPGPPASYTVVAGDTLLGIAMKLYHDAHRWREIAAANPRLDPRHLHPRQVIKLPAPPKAR